MLSMKEAIENYVEGCVGKVDCPAYKLFMKAILAGMMIAFGAAGSSVAAHDIANVGIARLVAGVVFPMGLMMVVMTEQNFLQETVWQLWQLYRRNIQHLSLYECLL